MARAKKSGIEVVKGQLEALPDDGQSQVIFADAVMNFGLGQAVSRLMLGVEVGDKKIKATHTLVMPTQRLIETISLIHTQVLANPKIREALAKGFEESQVSLDKDK